MYMYIIVMTTFYSFTVVIIRRRLLLNVLHSLTDEMAVQYNV